MRFAGKFLWETDKSNLLWTVLLNILFSLFIVPNLLLDKKFLDTLVNNINNPNSLATFHTILWVVAARLGLELLRSLFSRVSGYKARLLMMHVNQRAEVMIAQKYACVSIPTLEDPKFKDRYQKIERGGLDRLRQVTENYVRIPQHIAGLASSLSIFVLGQAWIAAVSLISLIPAMFVERHFIRKDYDLDTRVSTLHRRRSIYSYYLGRSRSYMELRILNIYKYLGQQISDVWQKIIDQRKSLMKEWRKWSYFGNSFDSAISYSFDAFFGYKAILGKISIGTAQAYIRAISSFKTSVTSLNAAVLELYENYLYLSDLVWFLDLEEPYSQTGGKLLPAKLNQGIKFENVGFKYPGGDDWILKDVTFDISPEQNIAIVGKNGAGKTTLVKLLCGFYKPTKGKITIDSHDISLLNKAAYWKRLSVLFQDFEGYNITARESIAVGNILKIGDTVRLKKYAQLVGINDWIEHLPNKYDNSLSREFEKGVTPSSGQWQRIAIARALFKDPEFLVLDEPTSNVDPEAEEQIFNKILDIGKKKIIVFISHRFSTVRRADKIIVLDKGTIIEQGSHSELMQLDKKYARLFQLQAKSYQ